MYTTKLRILAISLAIHLYVLKHIISHHPQIPNKNHAARTAPAYTSTYPTHTSPKTQRTMYAFVYSAPIFA